MEEEVKKLIGDKKPVNIFVETKLAGGKFQKVLVLDFQVGDKLKRKCFDIFI